MSMYDFDWNTLDDQTVTSKYGGVALDESRPETHEVINPSWWKRGRYQYTPTEYYTGLNEEGEVIIPKRDEHIKKIEDVGKLPGKVFTGTVIILGLIIVAGIVT